MQGAPSIVAPVPKLTPLVISACNCPQLAFCAEVSTLPQIQTRVNHAKTHIPQNNKSSEVTIAKVAAQGSRVECAGDLYSARARPDTVPPSEQPAMATETGE
ncbi:unnamed protein product [Euphydryas editha]|uniref:Uncharacterized protein n=1 Tax=Euphydryas editha TaxID=104508 RepID=A0AAU9UYA2_EUPED|nr:unnamed protein product [Euphydryas editha]